MSIVGNAPVSIPDGVTLTIDADVIKVKGSNGELQKKIPSSVGVSIDEKLVPEAFRHLLDDAVEWSIGDDVERDAYMS